MPKIHIHQNCHGELLSFTEDEMVGSNPTFRTCVVEVTEDQYNFLIKTKPAIIAYNLLLAELFLNEVGNEF